MFSSGAIFPHQSSVGTQGLNDRTERDRSKEIYDFITLNYVAVPNGKRGERLTAGRGRKDPTVN